MKAVSSMRHGSASSEEVASRLEEPLIQTHTLYVLVIEVGLFISARSSILPPLIAPSLSLIPPEFRVCEACVFNTNTSSYILLYPQYDFSLFRTEFEGHHVGIRCRTVKRLRLYSCSELATRSVGCLLQWTRLAIQPAPPSNRSLCESIVIQLICCGLRSCGDYRWQFVAKDEVELHNTIKLG